MTRMPAEAEHKAQAPRSVQCFIVTVSDTRTEATDTSGRAIAELLVSAGHGVEGRTIVKDDAELVRDAIVRQLANPDVQAVITTGGTGITSRDSTYEAVNAMLLNEFLKQHRKVEDQNAEIATLKQKATRVDLLETRLSELEQMMQSLKAAK